MRILNLHYLVDIIIRSSSWVYLQNGPSAVDAAAGKIMIFRYVLYRLKAGSVKLDPEWVTLDNDNKTCGVDRDY